MPEDNKDKEYYTLLYILISKLVGIFILGLLCSIMCYLLKFDINKLILYVAYTIFFISYIATISLSITTIAYCNGIEVKTYEDNLIQNIYKIGHPILLSFTLLAMVTLIIIYNNKYTIWNTSGSENVGSLEKVGPITINTNINNDERKSYGFYVILLLLGILLFTILSSMDIFLFLNSEHYDGKMYTTNSNKGSDTETNINIVFSNEGTEYNNEENIIDEEKISDSYVYIGSGVAVDKDKVIKWLSFDTKINSDGTIIKDGSVVWRDGNQKPIGIDKSNFRSIYGFIPPSFTYYPEGRNNKNYNMENFSEGRKECMRACSETNCIAVQTEVPEYCSQFIKNRCGDDTELGCTLFYDTIENSDDAYWKLSNIDNGKGCFKETNSTCLGAKYYEEGEFPTELPLNEKPSTSSIPFCSSKIKNHTNCIERKLTTTEYASKKYPYYYLPMNISNASPLIPSENVNNVVLSVKYKEGFGKYKDCGLVNGNLVSCTTDKFCKTVSEMNCLEVDTSTCEGSIYDKEGSKKFIEKYKENYNSVNPPGSNYIDLYPSCYYRQKTSVVIPVQIGCNEMSVQRGCFGSPEILYTENVSNANNIVACSDTNVVPSSKRCLDLRDNNKFLECNDFYYPCGSNSGDNNLWVRRK